MDKVTFDKLVASHAEISAREAAQLEELLASFPYCQIAHLLLAKESHDKNSMLFPQKLRKAATYALDRKVLHGLIHKREGPSSASNKKTAANSEVQKKTIIESTPPLNSSENIALLTELENNLKLLREQKRNYSPPKKNMEVNSLNDPSQPINSKSISDGENQPVLGSFSWPNLFVGESQLGAELTPATSSSQAEIDLLLSYLDGQNRKAPTLFNSQDSVIDKFIENEPKISRASGLALHESAIDLSKPSSELNIEITTENFAQILVKQNKLEKAKEVYRKLMLKYPDKSAYFAGKLNELESK
jgi:hypothetical protein